MDELAEYDGSGCDDGPVLVAVDGLVYNVAKARNFYGPGGEYAVMGGTDATRFLEHAALRCFWAVDVQSHDNTFCQRPTVFVAFDCYHTPKKHECCEICEIDLWCLDQANGARPWRSR